MQIWVLHSNPIKSAQLLLKVDKRRAQKMVIEFLQASATLAEDIWGRPIVKRKDGKYMKTALARRFPKPILDWLKESWENYKWVWDMCLEINPEYIDIYWEDIKEIYCRLPDKPQTPFINYAKSKAKNLDFTHIKDVPTAYREYLKVQKIIIK